MLKIMTRQFTYLVLILCCLQLQMPQCLSLHVSNGVYSRVTLEIDPHSPEPTNCPSFFTHLESVLNETSTGLHRLSDNASYISDFQIILPSSWNRCRPSRLKDVMLPSPRRSLRPDITVSSRTGLFEPRTEQFGPCGSLGYGINVPLLFLYQLERAQTRSEVKNKAKILLREWIKYAFGVFPEHGFSGDQMYPISYADGNDIKFNSGCKTSDDPFCPLDEAYDPSVPSKQNLLCNSLSVSQIIQRNTNKSNSSMTAGMPLHPSYNYVVKKSNKLTILLDRTSTMGVRNRWTNVKRAFYRFIQYLPEGTKLSIISFGSEAVTDLPSTVLLNSNREGCHGRIPRKILENEDIGCVTCALNLSLSSMTNYLGNIEPGTDVILLTPGDSSSNPEELSRLMRVIDDVPIRLYPVIYPSNSQADHILPLANNGKPYVVPENSSDPLAILSETLLDILRETQGASPTKFHEAKYFEEFEISGGITMEEELLTDMSVTLSINDEERIQFFELTNPSGKKHLFSKFEDGMVIFNIPGRAESGVWTYHAKLYPEATKESLNAMSVDAVSHSSDGSREPFQLEAFSSTIVHDNASQPIILYARLTQGKTIPVLDAIVRAKVHRPGGIEPIEVLLRDNGLVSPDSTRNDGIYSAYFSEFSNVSGLYSFQVSASQKEGHSRTPKSMKLQRDIINNAKSTHNSKDVNDLKPCCGSVIHYEESLPTPQFHRQTVGNGFYVREGRSEKEDIIPPSRVLDLRVEGYTEGSVKLRWTAPGDDYDKGKASKYEIRCHTSRDALSVDLFSEKGILVHSSFIPEPSTYGTQESCIVAIPWPNEKFYYSLLALDESGNPSALSNIVSAYIYEAPTTLPPLQPTTKDPQGLLPLRKESDLLRQYELYEAAGIYIIAGSILGLLLLLLAIIGALRFRKRSKCDEKETYTTYEPGEPKTTVVLPSSESKNEAAPNLKQWLDSLPNSSLSDSENCLMNKPHYPQKVLTNGSFLNLKEGSDDSSTHQSRPTTCTTDPDCHSEHSEGSNLKRSMSINTPPSVILEVAPVPMLNPMLRSKDGHTFNRSPHYLSFREGSVIDPLHFTSYSNYHMSIRGASQKKIRTESVV